MLSCITVLLISYSLVIMYVSFLRVTVFVTVDTLTCFFFLHFVSPFYLSYWYVFIHTSFVLEDGSEKLSKVKKKLF